MFYVYTKELYYNTLFLKVAIFDTGVFPSCFFWPGSYTGPKVTVNCVNSQVALDDTAERKSVHIKRAYVVGCVEAETGRHGEKTHLTEAEQRGKERDNLKFILKEKELVDGKNRKMETCRDSRTQG